MTEFTKTLPKYLFDYWLMLSNNLCDPVLLLLTKINY